MTRAYQDFLWHRALLFDLDFLQLADSTLIPTTALVYSRPALLAPISMLRS